MHTELFIKALISLLNYLIYIAFNANYVMLITIQFLIRVSCFSKGVYIKIMS